MPDISGGIDVDGKMPSTDFDSGLSGDAYGGFDINLPKFKLPKFGVKVGKPEFDSPDLSLSGPDIKGKFDVGSPDLGGNVDLDIKTPEFDAKVGDIDIDLNAPKVSGDLKCPDIDLDTSLDGEGRGSFNMKMPKFKMPKFGFKGKKGKIDIDTPDVDIDLPSAEGDLKINCPDISLPGADINVDVKKPSIEGEIDVEIPDAKINVDSPDLGGDLKLKMPKMKMPKFGMNLGKSGGKDFELPDVDVQRPDVDVSLPDVNLGLEKPMLPSVDANLSIDGSAPDVGFKTPDLDHEAGGFNINMPKFKLPKFDLKFGKSGKFDGDIPTLEGSLPDADLKIPSPKLDFDVNMPSINMPDISGGIDVDGKMPSTDFDSGLSGDASVDLT